MKTKIWAIITAIFLAGCASVGQKVDQSAVSKIQKGTSTKADVRRLIGDPNKVAVSSEGVETWTYSYSHAQVKGESWIPVYGAFGGGTRVQTQETVVKFVDGVVTEYTTAFGGTEVTSGLASGTSAKIKGAEGERSTRSKEVSDTPAKEEIATVSVTPVKTKAPPPPRPQVVKQPVEQARELTLKERILLITDKTDAENKK